MTEMCQMFIYMLAASVAVFATVALIYILITESWVFFEHVSIVEFLTGTEWTPLFENAKFGVLPLLAGTLVTSFVALLVAIPLGLVVAIYLSEFAPHKVRGKAVSIATLRTSLQQAASLLFNANNSRISTKLNRSAALVR